MNGGPFFLANTREQGEQESTLPGPLKNLCRGTSWECGRDWGFSRQSLGQPGLSVAMIQTLKFPPRILQVLP